MRNRTLLLTVTLSMLFIQACSRSAREVSEPVTVGPLVTEPTSSVKSQDDKYLCDFQWTKGASAWDYADAQGDKEISDAVEASESWCLIPYGESTTITIGVTSNLQSTSYVCRDMSSDYTMQNEIDMTVAEGIHSQMKCVSLNDNGSERSIDALITANTTPSSAASYIDTKLYHVDNIDGLNTIMGHLNLKLVEKKHFSVLFEPIYNTTDLSIMQSFWANRSIVFQEWNKYLSKLGYTIDVDVLPIFYPNAYDQMQYSDGMLTLPEEKDIVEIFSKIVEYYNTGLSYVQSHLDEDLSDYSLKSWDYVIALTPAYTVKRDVKGTYTAAKTCTGTDQNGNTYTYICENAKCSIEYTISQSLDIIKQFASGKLPGTTDLTMDVYNSGKKKIISDAMVLIPNYSVSEPICNSASYGITTIANSKAHSFSIHNGTLIVDADFSDRGNKGRLLAGALYGKMLGRNPFTNDDNGRWLSAYYDDPVVEQPSKDWNR